MVQTISPLIKDNQKNVWLINGKNIIVRRIVVRLMKENTCYINMLHNIYVIC